MPRDNEKIIAIAREAIEPFAKRLDALTDRIEGKLKEGE